MIRALIAGVLGLAVSAGAALADPGISSVQLKPGGFVEVAVIDEEPVRAMELIAPDGRTIRAISLRKDRVYERQGPSGAYFSDRPAYVWRPGLPYGWHDPFWDPWPYNRHSLWGRSVFGPPFWPVPVPRSKAFTLSTGRILVGDTAAFRQSWPQWRLRIAYDDGRVVEYRVPRIEYQS